MVASGRKYVKIEAPIMKIQGAYVWMDRHWPEDLFKWMRQEKMVFTELKMGTNKSIPSTNFQSLLSFPSNLQF